MMEPLPKVPLVVQALALDLFGIAEVELWVVSHLALFLRPLLFFILYHDHAHSLGARVDAGSLAGLFGRGQLGQRVRMASLLALAKVLQYLTGNVTFGANLSAKTRFSPLANPFCASSQSCGLRSQPYWPNWPRWPLRPVWPLRRPSPTTAGSCPSTISAKLATQTP